MIRRRFSLDRLARQTTASASVEFALMVPMLVILLFGGAEAGHFVWTQHKLVEAVRDGARFASRLPVTGTDGVCNGSAETISTDQIDQIKLVTRTGQLASASAKSAVPAWTDAQVTVTVVCDEFVDTGIYADLGDTDASGAADKGPVVTVAATGVGYPWLFNGLGFMGSGFTLSARSSAAVMGI
jgi:Flp pilus assembly protein TadG